MWNLYNFKDQKESDKIFGWVHKILKYKIVVPLTNWFGKFIDKHVDYKMRYNNHSKIYFAFMNALDKTKTVWRDEWACTTYKTTPQVMRKHLIKQYKIIESFKKLLLTICKYDTAYDAFFKIFSFEYAKQLQSRFRFDKYVPLFASRNANDVSYMMVQDGFAVIKGKRYRVLLEEDNNGNVKTQESK